MEDTRTERNPFEPFPFLGLTLRWDNLENFSTANYPIQQLRSLWKMYYMKCGVWNQMKIWSSHLLDNLSNCLMNLKNSGDSTGFEPMTSAMPVQCSNQLSYEVTQLRAGQFVGLMFSRERNVVWKMYYMKCGVWNQMKISYIDISYIDISYLHLISNTALHIIHLSYYIPFTGKHEPNKLTCSQLCDFIAQLVRALHRHRRGHGFESRGVTWIFQVHETIA